MEDLSKEAFLEILRRYRSGTASDEEIALVHSYYEAFEFQPDILDTFTENERNEIEAEVREGLDIQLRFQDQIAKKRMSRKILIRWSVAASVAALVLSAFFLFKTADQQQSVSSTDTTRAVIRKNNLVQLPDGSTVILSADSKIDYPTSFEKESKRVVYLTGQAYFDIQSNPDKPFVVHTGNLVTTVLGTAFNIKALPGEKSITVTVTRGKVQVANQKRIFSVLLPQQQMVYDIPKDEAVREVVDAAKVVEWKEDDLYFDDITVSTASAILSERFQVAIEIKDEQLKNQRFTTTFGRDENLESILTSITTFSNATYKVSSDKKHIVLSPK